MASDSKSDLKGDEKILQEAKDRFKRCEDWEGPARARFIEDVKFAEGDSDNKWQWEGSVYDARIGAKKPALTVNKTREHNLQILNDQRQNKSQIKIRPVGGDATFKSAQIYEGIVRHIEYQSRALEAYDAGAYNQIYGGWGYWRLATDYADADSFDQEIFIKRVRDPLSIYLDPDIQEFDGSDARFGFAFEDISRERYDADYPDADKDDGKDSGTAMDWGTDGWWDKDMVRVAEYFRKSEKADTLLLLDDQTKVLKSEVPKEYLSDKGKEGTYLWNGQAWVTIQKTRDVTNPKVEWFKIAGNKIVDRNTWPGSYIPLIRVIGEETIVNGELDRKGHTRSLKDPQRMYNYYTSAAVEYAAGQTKTPYIGPAQAFEGLETLWNNANIDTLPYLPYNARDDEGRDLPPPTKIAPPVSHSAAMEGMKIAQMEMMMASGQYQSQFGENENAKSGIAIQTRQRQGDNATYHFIDHLAQAIEFTGRQLIDLIPKVYDTPRVIKIMADDGTQTEVNLDPNGPPYEQRVNGQPASEEEVKSAESDPNLKDSIETVFNPNVGKYGVEADIGPAFNTRRQEGFAAMTEIAKMNPDFMKIGGDLYFRQADFPLADELAERFKRAIPPQLLGEGVPPQVAQMQEQFQMQMQHMQQVISQLIQANAEKETKLRDKGEDNKVRLYQAETQRMSAVGAIDPEAMKPVVRQLASEALGTPIVPLMAAHAHAEQHFMPEDPATQEQQPEAAE